MPSDTQISVMVEVARMEGAGLTAEQVKVLHSLIDAGWVVAKGEPDKFELTPSGQQLLDARGVGANES